MVSRLVCSASSTRHANYTPALRVRAKSGCEQLQRSKLFDHLVGAREQSCGHFEPQCLGRLEIDY
jgi:hypothetical protein